MKHLLHPLACLFAVAATALGAPLQKNQVPTDAKWLLHVDMENLRNTEFGKFATKHLAALADAKSDFKVNFGPIFQKIGHITAYGDQYETGPQANGVLLIQMDAETQKILEGFFAAQMLAAKDDSIKKMQQEAAVMYSVKNELFVAIHPDHLAVVSKSQKQIQKAREVLAGKAPNLRAAPAFSGFPPAPNTFFFLGVAEAFNQKLAMPPQAKILQMADGGRLVLGEKADKLFLEVILKAKTPDVIEQIKQVVQGMMALISLGQIDNPELQELVRGINVTSKENMVLVNVEYPLAKVLGKLAQAMGEDHHAHDRGKGKIKLEDEPEKKGEIHSSPKNEPK